MGYRRMLKSTWWRDQHGITGIETAIILIAFVVVTYLDSEQSVNLGLTEATTTRAGTQYGSVAAARYSIPANEPRLPWVFKA